MNEPQQKTAAAIEARADWAVLTSPDVVASTTGHVVPIEAGPSPFAGGPTTSSAATGRCAVVAANVEGAAAAASRADVTETCAGFGYETGPGLEANSSPPSAGQGCRRHRRHRRGGARPPVRRRSEPSSAARSR